MAAKKRVDEIDPNNGVTDPFGEAQESADFYETEVTVYADSLEKDIEKAFQQYGFSLYHSLPPSKQIPLSQKLGFFRNDAIDHYNLAGLELAEGNIDKATPLLEKAISLDPSIEDAHYNLALCYEKLDRKADALASWTKCREICEDEDSAKAIDGRLAELTA